MMVKKNEDLNKEAMSILNGETPKGTLMNNKIAGNRVAGGNKIAIPLKSKTPGEKYIDNNPS